MAGISKKPLTFWDVIPSYEDEWGHLKWLSPVKGMVAGSSYAECGMRLVPANTPNGKVWSLTFREDDPPFKIIEVTDEKVLEKLRTIKGQEPFSHTGLPIFWHENLEKSRPYL
jgi:hypothetical protein